MHLTNIYILVEFVYNGVNYKYTCPYNQLNRNYDDEHYAYFLKNIPNTECGLFEINIIKEEEKNLIIEDGYVAIYSTFEQGFTDEIIGASIAFV